MSKFNLGLAAMTTALATLKPTKAAAPEVEAATALQVTTDSGSTLDIDTGDRETYAVGDTVNSDGTAVADADYVLTDGNTITVASGAITAITPADTTDTTASADVDTAIAQIAEAVTALANRMGSMETRLTATTNMTNRVAAATGSKAVPARAQAANDEDKEADVDPVKAAGDKRKARREAKFK